MEFLASNWHWFATAGASGAMAVVLCLDAHRRTRAFLDTYGFGQEARGVELEFGVGLLLVIVCCLTTVGFLVVQVAVLCYGSS